ncbi:unnamed protein product [Phytophthora lilii]|uniref:RxLR effector protein n=1 Tax=Phytophthora lilii TaxID=2077276 RepID=A0A9W7CMW6_9STRA|nr:unnamed protein product [Phytophthora lilii]
MRLHQNLLVLVVTFLISTGALAEVTPSSRLPLSVSLATQTTLNARRLLRADKNDEINAEETEEKGFWKRVKVEWWLQMGTADDNVKAKLKLTGLKGKDLTSHKNFKRYKQFANKAENYRLNQWLRNKFTTYDAWNTLKLPQANSGFRRKVKAGYNPPAKMVSREATEVEMTLRTLIMARSKVEDNFAKLALGLMEPGKPLTTLKGSALTSSSDYKYF